jgi:hypothetical protein
MDLVAMWLAGHPQEMRVAVLMNWLDSVGILVPIAAAQISERRKPRH